MKPHAVPSHVAVPLTGATHGVHREPQLFTSVLATHTPPQRWYPASQEKPHKPAMQVAVAFAGGTAHGVHDAPHVPTLELLTHAPAQS